MKSEAWRVVFTGLSLTCVTATALFVLVAVNPKDAGYGGMPWPTPPVRRSSPSSSTVPRCEPRGHDPCGRCRSVATAGIQSSSDDRVAWVACVGTRGRTMELNQPNTARIAMPYAIAISATPRS